MKTNRVQPVMYIILLAVLCSWLGIAVFAQTARIATANGASASAPTAAAIGKGTVTSVGLTAPTSDFFVTGSPVTSSGTLGLNWNILPTDSNTPNAIVKRRSDGSFDAGTINVGDVHLQTMYGTILAGGHGIENGSAIYANEVDGTVPAIYGECVNNCTAQGVEGRSYYGWGVYGFSDTNVGVNGYGLTGVAGNALTGGDGIYGQELSGTGYAGFFYGNVDVDGNLSKAGGSFKIDHPLDPANKYLYHSFVESPDMMNIYNGNVSTNGQGIAVVDLPDWFESLNRDFRYQLTVVGQFAQAIVASEVANHQFTIQTDKPNVKVSWQVTGIRQDAWANAHRIPLEEDKAEKDRGFYMHPELFGAPPEQAIALRHRPKQARSAEK